MTSLLWRQNLRWLMRSPWQALVPVMGVALGVAAVVAIDLAKSSADESFRLSTESVVGRATHVLVGGPTGLDERIYLGLRLERGLRSSAPVVEGSLFVGERSLRVLGVDPFVDAPLRPHLSPLAQPGGEALAALLTQPGGVLLADGTARQLGVKPGEALQAVAGGRRQAITVIGVLTPEDVFSRTALENLVVCDISTAQELLGMPGRLSRVDMILAEAPEGEQSLAEIRAALPPGVTLVRSAFRSKAVDEMTRAFRINLTALSMLGLLVGMFLIYNALTFSVVQRRTLFGRLKSIGVTRREILALVLGEGLVIGAIGTAIGLALGRALASVLLGPVTQTLRDLYVDVNAGPVTLSTLSLATGVALGIGATLTASLIPALEATASPPVQVLARSNLESRLHHRAPWLAALGGTLLVSSLPLLGIFGRNLIAGIGVLFVIVVGYALLVPAATVLLMGLLRPVMRFALGPLGAMVCRGVTASLSRTGVAIAALAIALAVTVGVDLMVRSFRHSVDAWLSASLAADIYVTSGAPVSAGGPTTPLHSEVLERYAAAPGVASIGTNRSVEVDSTAGRIELAALDIGRERYESFLFVDGSSESTWPRFRDAGEVVIPEPLAYRLELGVADRIALNTGAGYRDFPVAAVVRSYASDQGVLLMHRATYDRYWSDPAVNAIAIDVVPGVSVEAMMQTLRERTPADASVRIQSNRALREASLQVFDRTFAVTQVLRAIAVVVAFAGVVGALLALALERQREFGILRATGLLPRQVRALVMMQTGLLGLLAGLLALPLGLGIAWLLVHVINRRSFGWSLDFVIGSEPMLQAIWIALMAALIAGIHPALRMARMRTADALREE